MPPQTVGLGLNEPGVTAIFTGAVCIMWHGLLIKA